MTISARSTSCGIYPLKKYLSNLVSPRAKPTALYPFRNSSSCFLQVMSSSGPCTSAWEEVGLSALLFSLDEQALAIAGNQESSLESRRAIAGQAKSFKAAVNGSVGATSELGTAAQALVSVEIAYSYPRARERENRLLFLRRYCEVMLGIHILLINI